MLILQKMTRRGFTLTSCFRRLPSDPMHVITLGRLTPPQCVNVLSKLAIYVTFWYLQEGSTCNKNKALFKSSLEIR